MANWYVRPNTGHNGTRDGTSYTSAWGGWSEVVWGVSGVAPGDTLYLCGAHTSTSNITVGVHGATNEAGRVFISGAYSLDPGSITFTGSGFLNCARAYTEITDLILTGHTNTTVVFLHGSGSFSNYKRLDIRCNGGVGINLYAIDGQHHSDVLIDSCRFSGTTYNTAGSASALHYYLEATNATGSVQNLTITNNIFENLNTARGAVHLRTDSDVNTASVIQGIVCSYNTFRNIKGKPMEISNGTDIYGVAAGLQVKYNVMTDCYLDESSRTLGGCTFYGFTYSTALGKPDISYNRFENVVGRAGAVNVFYGTYNIHHNYANGLLTENIDGNGILIDHVCDETDVWANEMYNIKGNPLYSNSGCAIMVLDATNCRIWGNLFSNVYVGIHIGPAGSGQSCSIFNNTIDKVELYGVDVSEYATKAAAIVKNNIITAKSSTALAVRNVGSAWTNEDYNYFYGFASPSNHTFGANSVTSFPQLRNYFPLSSVLDGVFVSMSVDKESVLFNNPPTRGAYQYVTRGIR